jgi:hypothetical protein
VTRKNSQSQKTKEQRQRQHRKLKHEGLELLRIDRFHWSVARIYKRAGEKDDFLYLSHAHRCDDADEDAEEGGPETKEFELIWQTLAIVSGEWTDSAQHLLLSLRVSDVDDVVACGASRDESDGTAVCSLDRNQRNDSNCNEEWGKSEREGGGTGEDTYILNIDGSSEGTT